jgi:hypothetical protein
MIIGINGTTEGIGCAIAIMAENEGNDVRRLDRKNGFFLPDQIEKFVEEASQCDVFINNVYPTQFNVLQMLTKKWKNKEKIIVNISENLSNVHNKMRNYDALKLLMDPFSEAINNNPNNKIRIVTIRPGATDKIKTIPVDEIAKIVMMVLKCPECAWISSVTVRGTLRGLEVVN